ncbi:asparagine synthase (glutamine-hydrolyzing) [Microvirga massiliensis]|uniref:asparagine synthase (glutamine-hydrolyzing) n=1 Tax=Microvirga massiliensis TaxID=1033741 RepID=UPI00062BB35E|nr:asparagine synthase (glutamine-hydrolyzing) [Microvirga massiliensis]
MCGIFGWVVPSARALDSQVLTELTDLLRHRGPDGAGYWVDTSENPDWQIALGHRRLAIIDLSPGGAQPMSDELGRQLIFNGEIYNYLELKEELKGHQAHFRTSSDTEVLLKGLEILGPDILPKLRGMFAFALWDPKRGELILARDAFGKKPLYIAELPEGGLIFGSELHALTAFPGLDRSFDWDSLEEYLVYRYVPGPNTFFRSIKKLPPGHFAVWSNGNLTIRRYYTPPFADTEPEPIGMNEAVKRFTETLQESVRLRLRSDAPFGAFLSGGIDSAAVVGLMSQELGRPVQTFSAGFSESDHSELPYARLVASHFRAHHHEIVVPSSAVFDFLSEAVWHRGAPVSEPADIPILLLAREAAKKVKMVLTGEGSDELLAGYPKHKFEPRISQYQWLLPSILQDTTSALANRLPYGARRAATALRAFSVRDPEARMAVWFGAMSPTEAGALMAQSRPRRRLDPFPFSGSGSALKRTLLFDQTSWLPDNLLERGDRMMMAAGIEGRMPFMDVELARTVAAFPDHILLGAKGGKAVLREAVGRLLPREILKRRKVGFRVPVELWFRTTLRDYLHDHLLGADSQVAVMCDRNKLAQMFDEHTTGRRNHEKTLWALLNLEIFTRVFRPSLT